MNTVIVLAGGVGRRLGADIPKQYLKISSRTILSYVIELFSSSAEIDNIQIVADKFWHELIKNDICQYDLKHKFIGFSQPGLTRQLSVYNALIDLKEIVKYDDIIIIHDAVRPFLTLENISEYINKLNGYEGVIPTLPLKDTVYFSEDGQNITSLINRNKIIAGQSPELFVYGKYLQANEKLVSKVSGEISEKSEIFSINGSAEPAVLSNMNLRTVQGSDENFKITTNADLIRAKNILEGTVK
ncbi:MAG: D-ribitol-5-phosphate cytidylyltransferase [Clostridium butyricum]|uniref:IspD/TarI family cytidylyltransferase n=1 Tax=Enterococcus sp. TaxID=35783 RepID=UPI002586A1DA|nr:IspD/TarI family cytidylyltransferase [Enterococcus sp.]MDK2829403.1 D-ribitol-5-phosphate cytidylyltransferase [Clostridium butyricum]MDK2844671.1 D-ribitol-5-phosphate cytidylyltransferase [Enterococcus sp.]